MTTPIYDPSVLNAAGEAVLEEARRYLERARTRPYPSLKPDPPRDVLARARKLLDQRPKGLGAADLAEHARLLTRQYLEDHNPLFSPHYIGHQVAPPVPFAAVFALAGATANTGAAVFEMGPSGVSAEIALGEKLASYLGWKSGFGSIATHGGSLANLTAVLAARNSKFPEYWKKGSGGKRPALLTSQDAHYSVARAAGILGLGTDSVIKVGLDQRRKLDPSKLPEALKLARKQGFEPFCIVASSCGTPIGAFDPLESIAEFARKESLWLHVDAAHGGGLLLSKRHAKLMAGITQADSVTWDAHKMMFVPSLCTFLLYREAAKSYTPFAQDAPYLFDSSADDGMSFDPGLRTVECTKGPIALMLWALWSAIGPEGIAALVDSVIESARTFHDLIGETSDFQALHEPECNVLCFRHLPAALRSAPLEKVSAFQLKLRQALLKSGRFYITGTSLDGAYALRVTVMNVATGRDEFLELLEELRRLGKSLL